MSLPKFSAIVNVIVGFHIISPLLRPNLFWSPQGQMYTSIQTHTSHAGITLSCNSILTPWHLGRPVTLAKHMHITHTHTQPTRFAHHLHCLACSICRASAAKWTGSFPIQPLAIWWPGLALVIDGICRCVHGEGPWGPGMADLKHTEIHMGVGGLVGRGDASVSALLFYSFIHPYKVSTPPSPTLLCTIVLGLADKGSSPSLVFSPSLAAWLRSLSVG